MVRCWHGRRTAAWRMMLLAFGYSPVGAVFRHRHTGRRRAAAFRFDVYCYGAEPLASPAAERALVRRRRQFEIQPPKGRGDFGNTSPSAPPPPPPHITLIMAGIHVCVRHTMILPLVMRNVFDHMLNTMLASPSVITCRRAGALNGHADPCRHC